MKHVFDLKKAAKVLGDKWVYKTHPVHNPLVPNMTYKGYESLSFEQTSNISFVLSMQFHDPDALFIGTDTGVNLEVSFGPITCFHYQKTEEPKVIIESMVADRVNFIEISSDGKIRIYHYFKKDAYRTFIKHNPSI